MNELSGQNSQPLSDAEVLRLGWCPKCHCPESHVARTRKLELPEVRRTGGRTEKVTRIKVIRYRVCDACGANFRTTEQTG
jgi:predicted nucleic-acid-binding Zn-ribbon protein